MSFCTAINCMDGRVQTPVIEFLRKRFAAAYVDAITEPGPNAILARNEDADTVASILRRTRISVAQHGSAGIAVVGHDDCAGNPVGRDEQDAQTRAAVALIRREFPDVTVIGLWVDAEWRVSALDG